MRFEINHEENKYAVQCVKCDATVSPHRESMPDHEAIHYANAHAAAVHGLVEPASGQLTPGPETGQRILTLVGGSFGPGDEVGIPNAITEYEAEVDCDRCGRGIKDTEADPIMTGWDEAVVCKECHAAFENGEPFDAEEPVGSADEPPSVPAEEASRPDSTVDAAGDRPAAGRAPAKADGRKRGKKD